MINPGTPFGHYAIIDLLGQGGMGEVYRATDTRLDRLVALKVIKKEYSASLEYRTLFTNEAKAAARIDSVNVVKIWEHGELDDQLYISTELVEGPDLRAAGSFMSFDKKLQAVRQLVGGVCAAHKVGLLHRDLKPENVLISKDSVLKILDFGLAKQVADQSVLLAQQLQTKTLGKQEHFAGTIAYASPEQLSGDVLTFCSDVFSLGVIFYELFVGSRPFQGVNPGRLIYSILYDDPPSPRDAQPELPLWLDQVILRSLAKRPAGRYQSAEQLLQALERPKDRPDLKSDEAIIRPRQTVTVVGLRNMSGDPSWDYFSEGFTEDIIRELGRRTNMIVTPQPSKAYSPNLSELFKTFNTDYIITGSLFKWQNRIRMNLNVHRSQDAQLVAGESYEGHIDDLFSLLSGAAQEVAGKLAVSGGTSTIETGQLIRMDVGAYEYYLKGRTYYQTNTPENLNFAEMMYQRALEIDPNSALAHAGLSDLYTMRYMCYYDRTAARIEAAKTEALAALEVAPRLAEGYRSLGRYYQQVGDYTNAEQSLQKAIDCNPKYAMAYRAMAWLKEVQGNHEDSMRWAKRTLELAPLDLETMLLIGLLYMDTRKYTAALSTLQRAVELGPDYGRAHYELASVYLKIGALDEALNNFQLACKYKGDPNAYIQAGYVLLIQHKDDAARELFAKSIEEGFFPFVAAYFIGFLERRQGNSGEACKFLEKSIELGVAYDPEDADSFHVLAYRALALAASGRFSDALLILESLSVRKAIDGEGYHCMARAYALMGDTVKTAEYRRLAVAAHAGPTEIELKSDPHFESQ